MNRNQNCSIVKLLFYRCTVVLRNPDMGQSATASGKATNYSAGYRAAENRNDGTCNRQWSKGRNRQDRQR